MGRLLRVVVVVAVLGGSPAVAQTRAGREADVLRLAERSLRLYGVQGRVLAVGVKALPSSAILLCGVVETASGRETFRGYVQPDAPFLLTGMGVEAAAEAMGCYRDADIVVRRPTGR